MRFGQVRPLLNDEAIVGDGLRDLAFRLKKPAKL